MAMTIRRINAKENNVPEKKSVTSTLLKVAKPLIKVENTAILDPIGSLVDSIASRFRGANTKPEPKA